MEIFPSRVLARIGRANHCLAHIGCSRPIARRSRPGTFGINADQRRSGTISSTINNAVLAQGSRPVGDTVGQTSRASTFAVGSNNLAKVTPPVLRAWAPPGRRPGSRLALRTHALGEAATRDRVRARLVAHGLPVDRVALDGGVPHQALLAAYGEIDIALDPFPYAGGLTVCEALWMGVPVVALAGDSFCARHALSHLANTGLPDWVAASEADYVALAIDRARDLPRGWPACAPACARGLPLRRSAMRRASAGPSPRRCGMPGAHGAVQQRRCDATPPRPSGLHCIRTSIGRRTGLDLFQPGQGLACRGCGATLTEEVADLGLVPLSVDPVRVAEVVLRAVACAPAPRLRLRRLPAGAGRRWRCAAVRDRRRARPMALPASSLPDCGLVLARRSLPSMPLCLPPSVDHDIPAQAVPHRRAQCTYGCGKRCRPGPPAGRSAAGHRHGPRGCAGRCPRISPRAASQSSTSPT